MVLTPRTTAAGTQGGPLRQRVTRKVMQQKARRSGVLRPERALRGNIPVQINGILGKRYGLRARRKRLRRA